MDFTKLTLEALKAAAYDNFVAMEQAQTNIRALNAELQSRMDAAAKAAIKENE